MNFGRLLLAIILLSAVGISQTGSAPNAPKPQPDANPDNLKQFPPTAPGFSDLKPPEQPRPLVASSVKSLQIPVFSSYGESFCDSDGNMFFHGAVDASTFNGSPIMKISHDGESTTYYKPSGNTGDQPVYFMSFTVSPAGTVRELAEVKDGVVVLAFDSDGNESSRTTLDVPDHVAPQEFSSFENGEMVFYGYYDKDAPEALRGRRYIGIFAPSGKLIKKIDDAEHLDLDQFSKHLRGGAATLGSDGNVYLLRDKDVVVISQSGEVLRRFPFNKNPSDAIADNIVYSDGLLAIFLSVTQKGTPFLQRRYLILDSSSGEQRGFYAPANDADGVDVCFSRKEGFTFLHNIKDTLYLIQAPLR
ncbi:MAG TPA: hypothetical protein VFP71_12100 [Candidatus Angelobacter sp.]|nr:hypothetical protein [Candidatus Angelobacter sp.]